MIQFGIPPAVAVEVLDGSGRGGEAIQGNPRQDVAQDRPSRSGLTVEGVEVNMISMHDGSRGERLDPLRDARRQIEVVHSPAVRIIPGKVADSGQPVPGDGELEGAFLLRRGPDGNEGDIERPRRQERVLGPQPFPLPKGGNELPVFPLQPVADPEILRGAGRDSHRRAQDHRHAGAIPPAFLLGNKGVAEKPQHPPVIQLDGIGSIPAVPSVPVGEFGEAHRGAGLPASALPRSFRKYRCSGDRSVRGDDESAGSGDGGGRCGGGGTMIGDGRYRIGRTIMQNRATAQPEGQQEQDRPEAPTPGPIRRRGRPLLRRPRKFLAAQPFDLLWEYHQGIPSAKALNRRRTPGNRAPTATPPFLPQPPRKAYAKGKLRQR